MNKKASYYFERISSFAAALILLQTLYFKFSGAPESVYIFSTLHAEPWGRILTGILELLAGGLLLFRKTSIYGAAAGLAIISGAIGAHVFILGIVVQDDGGKLFMLAVVVVSCCCLTLLARRDEVKDLMNRVLHRNP